MMATYITLTADSHTHTYHTHTHMLARKGFLPNYDVHCMIQSLATLDCCPLFKAVFRHVKSGP